MTINETDLNVAADRLVQRDVILCLSGMVATLANASGAIATHFDGGRDLSSLAEQACELCSPVLDYEEAARSEGWVKAGEAWDHASEGRRVSPPTHWGIDPYEWEIFEHWAVSPWLAEKLAAEGERVDTDFAGLNVWGRTTTGQSISMDAVTRKIAADLLKGA